MSWQVLLVLMTSGVTSVYYKTWITLWVNSDARMANGTAVLAAGWPGSTSYYVTVYAALALALVRARV